MTQELSSECRACWLGRVAYRDAWALQEELARKRAADEIPDTLLLLEHPPTITLGRAADAAHILASAERLKTLGVEVVESDRGGDVTFHGPGQLVGYPILDLKSEHHARDLHLYLRRLEDVLIRTLASYQIEAFRFPPHTGVWTLDPASHQNVKIAAMGVKVSKWVTLHGFALNVCSDLNFFDLIVPCGIHEFGVTSIEAVSGATYGVEAVLPTLIAAFADVFSVNILRLPAAELTSI
jgi:lipoate-protein ligase B